MTGGAIGGIQTGARFAGGDLVYEIRVPLARDGSRPFGIGVEPGSVVRLVIEGEEIDIESKRESMGGRGGGRSSGGGMRGRGGKGGGGGMGGRGGGMDRGRPSPPQPIDYEAKVLLAVAPG